MNDQPTNRNKPTKAALNVLASCLGVTLFASLDANAQTYTLTDLPSSVSGFCARAEELASVEIPLRARPVKDAFRRAALLFEENLGQHDPEVRFLSRGPGYHAFFTETEMVLVLLPPIVYRATSG